MDRCRQVVSGQVTKFPTYDIGVRLWRGASLFFEASSFGWGDRLLTGPERAKATEEAYFDSIW